jgi:predicted AAA+ superfamily ATPase
MVCEMQGTLARTALFESIRQRLQWKPCVALLGARQIGKTTLARQVAAGHGGTVTVFDLEERETFAALQAAPGKILGEQTGLVIIDEIQRLPVLFEVLRPICDKVGRSASFLLLGSASWELVKGVSESLAGRVSFVDVPGFSLADVGGAAQLERLWLRGGFPLAFLAEDTAEHAQWLDDFFSTFIYRDLPEIGTYPGGLPTPALLDRFWRMLAHCHGQRWNGAELSKSLSISLPAVSRYRDILAGTFMLRVLPPWHENLGKRLVKSPKIYLRDSGILHRLLGIADTASLRLHPRYGASWEGFALEQTLIAHGQHDAYFYATAGGAELDLLLPRGDKRFGFEYKCTEAPSVTKSMHVALRDLALEHLYVVHPGKFHYPLDDKITALPLGEITSLAPLS